MACRNTFLANFLATSCVLVSIIYLFPVDSSSSLLAIYALFLLPSFFALFVLGSLLLRLFCWLFPHSVCVTLVRSYTHCCFFLLLLCFSTAQQIWLHLFYLSSYRSFNLDSRGLAVETPCKSKPGMLIFLSLHQILKLMHVTVVMGQMIHFIE